MRYRNRLVVLAVSALTTFSIVAAGCGDDDGAETTAAPDTTAAPTTTAAAYVNPGVGLQERDSEWLPDDWDEIVAAAAEEGEVVIYTNHPAATSDPMLAAFAEAFPDIEVREVRDSVDVLPTRYVQEHEADGRSPADVLHSSLFEAMVAEHPEWFMKIADLDPGFVPTLNDMLPAAFPADRPYSVNAASYIWNLVYNTDLLDESEIPSSWCDFADPSWGGNRGMIADPRASSNYRGWEVFILNECGVEFWDAIAANGFTLIDSVGSMAEQVTAGAFEFGFPNITNKTTAARAEGAPVAHQTVLPARLGWTSIMLPADAPNPNAQRVLATFLLSAQAQEIQCEYGDLSSLNSKVGGACEALIIDPSYELNDINISDEDYAALLEALGLS